MIKRFAIFAIAIGFLTIAAVGVSLAMVIDASAQPAQTTAHAGYGHRSAPRPMLLKDVAAYIGVVGGAVMLIGGGWGSWLHVKFNAVERKASGIGRALDEYKKRTEHQRDNFMERYRIDREAMMEKYATQVSLEKVEERMEAIRKEMVEGMQEIARSVDRMRETFKKPGGN